MIMYNGLTLAYIGDAVYELHVREHLLDKGYTKVNDLHENAIQYTSAVGQSTALKALSDMLDRHERRIIKRGRNQNATHKPKNAGADTYARATGFEALIGYLYLDGKNERIKKLTNTAFSAIDEQMS